MKKNRFLKITALLTAFFLLAESGNSYAGIPVQEPASLDIPDGFGHLEESFSGASDKTIIYIQDAHDSLEAQKNIAALVTQFTEKQGVKTVFEEGYEGPVPTERFFGFIQDPGIRLKVSSFLLDKLRIGGAEFAHINRKADFKLIGADNLDHYTENIRAFREAAHNNDAIEKDLDAILTDLESLAHQHFPKPFREWLDLKDRHENNQLDLLSYLERGWKILEAGAGGEASMKNLPRISLLLKAREPEDESLTAEAEQLDPRELFEEIARLDDYIARLFITQERDLKILRYRGAFHLLKRLNRIRVTPPEYAASRQILTGLKTRELADFIAREKKKSLALSRVWEENILAASRFYELAHRRDEAIENALESFVRETDEKTAVLVYGGFHKTGIREILRALGVSYRIITPHIPGPDPVHENYYKQLMAVGVHDYEKIFLKSAGLAPLAARPPSAFVEPFGEVSIRGIHQAVLANPQTPASLLDRKIAAQSRSEMRMVSSYQLGEAFGEIGRGPTLSGGRNEDFLYEDGRKIAVLLPWSKFIYRALDADGREIPERIYKITHYTSDNEMLFNEASKIFKFQTPVPLAGVPRLERAGMMKSGGLWIELRGIPAARSLDREIFGRPARLFDVLIRAGRILENIHSRGVVHGDVKPENIVINDQQEIEWIDFGGNITMVYAALDGEKKPIEDSISPDVDVYSFIMMATRLLDHQIQTQPEEISKDLQKIRDDLLHLILKDWSFQWFDELLRAGPWLDKLTPQARDQWPQSMGPVTEKLENALAGLLQRHPELAQPSAEERSELRSLPEDEFSMASEQSLKRLLKEMEQLPAGTPYLEELLSFKSALENETSPDRTMLREAVREYVSAVSSHNQGEYKDSSPLRLYRENSGAWYDLINNVMNPVSLSLLLIKNTAAENIVRERYQPIVDIFRRSARAMIALAHLKDQAGSETRELEIAQLFEEIRFEAAFPPEKRILVTPEQMQAFFEKVGSAFERLPADFKYKNSFGYELKPEAEVAAHFEGIEDEIVSRVLESYRTRGFMMGLESIEPQDTGKSVHSRIFWIDPANPNFRFGALLEIIKRGTEAVEGIYDQRDTEAAAALLEEHITGNAPAPQPSTVGLAGLAAWQRLLEETVLLDFRLTRSELRAIDRGPSDAGARLSTVDELRAMRTGLRHFLRRRLTDRGIDPSKYIFIADFLPYRILAARNAEGEILGFAFGKKGNRHLHALITEEGREPAGFIHEKDEHGVRIVTYVTDGGKNYKEDEFVLGRFGDVYRLNVEISGGRPIQQAVEYANWMPSYMLTKAQEVDAISRVLGPQLYEGLRRFIPADAKLVLAPGMEPEARMTYWPSVQGSIRSREEVFGGLDHEGFDVAHIRRLDGTQEQLPEGTPIRSLVNERGRVQWVFEDNVQSTAIVLSDLVIPIGSTRMYVPKNPDDMGKISLLPGGGVSFPEGVEVETVETPGEKYRVAFVYTHLALSEWVKPGAKIAAGDTRTIGTIERHRKYPYSPVVPHLHFAVMLFKESEIDKYPSINYDILNRKLGPDKTVLYVNPLSLFASGQRDELFLEGSAALPGFESISLHALNRDALKTLRAKIGHTFPGIPVWTSISPEEPARRSGLWIRQTEAGWRIEPQDAFSGLPKNLDGRTYTEDALIGKLREIDFQLRSEAVNRSELRTAAFKDEAATLRKFLKENTELMAWYQVLDAYKPPDPRDKILITIQIARGLKMKVPMLRSALTDADLGESAYRYLAGLAYNLSILYGTDFIGVGAEDEPGLIDPLLIEALLHEGDLASIRESLGKGAENPIGIRNYANAGRKVLVKRPEDLTPEEKETKSVTMDISLQTQVPGAYLGIDIGGGSSKWAVIKDGQILSLPEELKSMSTLLFDAARNPLEETTAEYIARMTAHARKVLAYLRQSHGIEKLEGAGMGMPGTADFENNRMVTLGQMRVKKGWRQEDVEWAGREIPLQIAAALALDPSRVKIRNDMDGILPGVASVLPRAKEDFWKATSGSFGFDWMGSGHGNQYASAGIPMNAPTEAGHLMFEFGRPGAGVFDTEAYTSIPSMLDYARTLAREKGIAWQEISGDHLKPLADQAFYAGSDAGELAKKEIAFTVFNRFADKYAANLALRYTLAERTGHGSAGDILLGGGIARGRTGALLKDLTMEKLKTYGLEDKIRITVIQDDDLRGAGLDPDDIGPIGFAYFIQSVLAQRDLRDEGFQFDSLDETVLRSFLKENTELMAWHRRLNAYQSTDPHEIVQITIQISRGLKMKVPMLRSALTDPELKEPAYRYLTAWAYNLSVIYGTGFVAVDSAEEPGLVDTGIIQKLLTSGDLSSIRESLGKGAENPLGIRNYANAGREVAVKRLAELTEEEKESKPITMNIRLETQAPGAYLGIDIGGSSAKWAVIQDGRILPLPQELRSTKTLLFDAANESVKETAAEYVVRLTAHAQKILDYVRETHGIEKLDGVGLDIPGAVDFDNNRMVTLGQIPGKKGWDAADVEWTGREIPLQMAAALNLEPARVKVRNDMDGVLLGVVSVLARAKEEFWNETKGDFGFDWMGTGHGNQYAVGGVPMNAPTEAGHLTFEFGKPGEGIFDTSSYTSIPSMLKFALELARSKGLSWPEIERDQLKPLADQVFYEGDAGNELLKREISLEVFNRFAEKYAANLALRYILAEGTGHGGARDILLGGGIARGKTGAFLKDLTLEKLKAYGLEDKIRITVIQDDDIQRAGLDPDNVGPIGSAYFIQSILAEAEPLDEGFELERSRGSSGDPELDTASERLLALMKERTVSWLPPEEEVRKGVERRANVLSNARDYFQWRTEPSEVPLPANLHFRLYPSEEEIRQFPDLVKLHSEDPDLEKTTGDFGRISGHFFKDKDGEIILLVSLIQTGDNWKFLQRVTKNRYDPRRGSSQRPEGNRYSWYGALIASLEEALSETGIRKIMVLSAEGVKEIRGSSGVKIEDPIAEKMYGRPGPGYQAEKVVLKAASAEHNLQVWTKTLGPEAEDRSELRADAFASAQENVRSTDSSEPGSIMTSGEVLKKGTLLIDADALASLEPAGQDELFSRLYMHRVDLRLVVFNEHGQVPQTPAFSAILRLSNVFRSSEKNHEAASEKYGFPNSVRVLFVSEEEMLPESRGPLLKAVRLKKRAGEIEFARLLAANGGSLPGIADKNGVFDPPSGLLSDLDQRLQSSMVVAYSA